jgi:hypothetical protein
MASSLQKVARTEPPVDIPIRSEVFLFGGGMSSMTAEDFGNYLVIRQQFGAE